jgi:autotransporter-associated beta strand protein
MKPRRLINPHVLFIGGLALLPAQWSSAASGSWSATTGSPASWATAANWGGTANVGSTEGDEATITTDIAAGYTINLNGLRTVGKLTIGDSNGSHAFSLANGTGGILTFDQTGSGTAMLALPSGTTATNDTISATIQLNDPLRAYSTSTAATTKTISGAISGIGKSITFDNDDGTTQKDPVSGVGLFTLSNSNNNYTGGTVIDDVRVQIASGAAFGGAIGGTVEVKDGGGVWINTTGAVDTSFNLTGTGWLEANGKLGAIKMGSGTTSSTYTINGNVTISGSAGDSGGTTPDASIFPHSTSTATTPTAGNGVINGVVSGGDLLVGSMSGGPATAYNGTETLSLTNANTYGDSIIKPLDTATTGQTILMIGGIDNTTATLGTGKVYLIGGTGGKTAALAIRRTDGFALQQDIETVSAAGTKTALITDVGGTGFTLNGKSVTVREQVRVGSSASGTSFNIDSGTITAAQFFTGNAATNSSTVNQTGGTVTLSGEVRVAHFPTETSVWNLSGGTLTLTGTPTANPFFTTGSTEGTTGMGTLYLGIDGQGIFNQTGGTVNAAAVVLDNRTDNGAGTNMTTGIDQYNLTGGTLNLGSATSAWGVQGNASSQFVLGGGTLKAGTSLPITVPMAANGTGSTLDTNSYTVTLKSGISGSGDLLLADSTSTTGKVVFDLATDAAVSANLSGSLPIEKTGVGLLTLAGANTFTGTTTVTAGGLRITGSSTSNTTVDGATLWTGGSLAGNLSLGATTNCTIGYGGTPLAVTGNVSIAGTNLVNPVAAGIPASGTYPLITCTGSLTGAGNLSIDPASTAPYRQSFGLVSNGTSVSLTVSGSNLSLVWNGIGSGSGTWDTNASAQWAGGEKFFNGDSATFNDTAASGSTQFATLKTTLANDFNDLMFTAKTAGMSGAAISIQYVVPTESYSPLTVTVIGNAITVSLETISGVLNSTSGEVKAKLETTAEANALVAVTHAAGDDGSGFVSAMATTYLNLTETVAIPTGVAVAPSGLVFANSAIDYVVNGPGSISGSTGLLKSGTGRLNLNTSNSFTGGTVIAKGELVAGAANAIGSGALTFGDATTTASDICTLTLTAGSNALTPITVTDTCLNARIHCTGGTIANTAITKKGAGRLTIGHPTVYGTTTNYLTGTSSVIVEKGTLAFISMTAAATGTDITLGNTNSGADDTVFEIPAATAADAPVINADFVLGTLGAGDTSKAIFRYVGAGASGGPPRIDGTLNLNGRDLLLENTSLVAGGIARLYNFAPKISGMGNVRVRCGTNPDGSASAVPRCRIMYSGNDWLGNLHVETGMLQIYTGAGGSINCIPNTSDVIVSAGTKIGMGCSDTINALTGGEATESLLSAEIAAALSSSTTTVTLTVGSNNGSGVFGGRLTSGGGYLALTKTGSGTQTMNGACAHVGNTTVSAGKLVMNGTNASSPVIVSAGATLGGNMTSTATVNSAGTAATGITATATGAKIAPGNSIGTITAVSVNLSTGGVLEMELDDTATPKHDQLVVTRATANALNITNATLSLKVTGTLAEDVYVLATCPTGGLTGTFATITGKPSNYDLVYNYDDGISTNNIALVKLSDPYLGWLAGYAALTGANRAPGVDFDGDGLDNGIEFVIGSNPTTFTGPETAGFPAATVTGGNLAFTFKRSIASKAYAVTVETSTDLAAWPPAGAYLVPTADTAGPPVAVAGETVTVTVPMGTDAKKFARVKTEIPFTP